MFKYKLKKLTNKEGEKESGNDKKKIENTVFFIVVLIITIIAINFIWNGTEQTYKIKTNETDSSKVLAKTTQNQDENQTLKTTDNLSQNLEDILSKIQGVEDIKVFIYYSESSETIAMYNENSKSSTTEETDTTGGIRKIQETDTQKDIIYQENNGQKTPMTKKVIQPKIEGAIITAKGANNIEVKTNIIQAVEAATGLATHKIQVFEMDT